MLILINSFSAEDPVKNLLELGVLWVIANHIMKGNITLEALVKASEDSAAEHHDTLLKGSGNHLLLILRLATTAAFLVLEHIAVDYLVIDA